MANQDVSVAKLWSELKILLLQIENLEGPNGEKILMVTVLLGSFPAGGMFDAGDLTLDLLLEDPSAYVLVH
jgi:hypothetical protein